MTTFRLERIVARFIASIAVALSAAAGVAVTDPPAAMDRIQGLVDGARVRHPGSPGNLAMERKIAALFAASGFTNGEVRFTAPALETGAATITPAGGAPIRAWPLHPSLFRPGNLPTNDIPTRLVYLGRGSYEDLEAVRGESLDGAVALMEFDSGGAWQRFMRFGVQAFVFIGRSGYTAVDRMDKVYRSEVSIPRFFITAEDGAALRRQMGGGRALDGQLRAEPSRWRDEILRDLWVFIPGRDPELERDVCVLVAPMDANSVVPDLAEGGQSAANLQILSDLLARFRRERPARSVMLAAVNAHTRRYQGERMLSWHLLAPGNQVEDVRNLLASDIRYQQLIIDTYRRIDLADRTAAEAALVDLRTLEDKSTGRNVSPKKPVVSRAKRDVNQVKTRLLRLQQAKAPPADREAEAARLKAELDTHVRILTLFNKVGIQTTLSDLTAREVDILRGYIRDIVAENESWVGLNRRDLQMDVDNGAVRDALGGRTVNLVVTLDLDWSTDQIGFCAIDPLNEEDVYGRRLGVNTVRLAGEVARRLGGESPLADTMTAPSGLPQQYFFYASDSAIGYFVTANNTPAVSLRNVFSTGGRLFAPDDTVSNLPAARVERLSAFVPELVQAVLADRTIMSSTDLPRAKAKAKSWAIQLKTFEFDQFSANVLPDIPVAGSLVLLYPPSIGAVSVAGDSLGCYSMMTDDRAAKVFYGLKEASETALPSVAFRMDPDFRRLEYVIDAGEAQQKVDSNVKAVPSLTVSMFPCKEIVVRERRDSSAISFTPITVSSYIVLEGAQNATPRRYGMLGSPGLSAKQVPISGGPMAVCVEDPDRVKILTAGLRLGLRSSPTAPEGTGVLSTEELGPDFFRLAAGDAAGLNRHRLKGLKGVANQLVDEFMRRGDAAWAEAESARESGDHNGYLRSLSIALGAQVKAYQQISAVTNDMLKAIVFYMALLLPFCFFTQRLMFKTTKIEVQMGLFAALFVLTFILFRVIHPAFRVSRSPEAIFIGFVMGILGLFVVWILHGRFEGEMQYLFGTLGGMDLAEIGYSAAGQEALLIGVHNMKRRRIRTTLTTATIVLVTFTMLAFSSISKRMNPTIIPVAKDSPYTGLFFQWPGSLCMDEATLAAVGDLFSRDAGRMAVRRWLLPPKLDWDSQSKQYNTFRVTTSAGGSAEIEAALGLSMADADFLGPMPLLAGGRYFSADDADEAMLPARAAAALGIGPEQVGKVTLRFRGRDLLVVGLLDDDRFAAMQDLNQTPLLPIKRVQTLGWQQTEAAASATVDPTVDQTGVFFVDLSALLVTPVETARGLGALPFSVSVQLKDSLPVYRAMEQLLSMAEAKFFVASREPFSVGEGGQRMNPAGVYYIGSGYKTSIGGLARLIIPLLISSTIILNTMLGSVYERKSEISIYNAVGLNPTHIGIFFLAEAFVYSVIGSVGGYLIGQMTSLGLLKLGWVRDINLNFSSLGVVYVILFTIAVVLLSTLYPAVVASRAAVPSGKRKWSMPAHDGNRMGIVFPFIYQAALVPGIIAYIEEYFARFSEASIGEVIAAFRGRRRGRDEQGREVYELDYDVALAPFDLGVTQRVRFRAAWDDVVQSHRIHMTIDRVSGQDSNWETTNKPFLEQLRKYLMHWRNLEPARRELYARQAVEVFDGR